MEAGLIRVVLLVATLLASSVEWTEGQFSDTPKHVPRFGRRSNLPPLEDQLLQQKRESQRTTGGIGGALARVDRDGDGCINIAELLRVPIVRAAVLLQNAALISEEAVDIPVETTGDAYQMDHLENSRMRLLLQK